MGGLYLLSGFPTAIARSDPFGISRRFGKPAPPAKFYKPHHLDTTVLKKKSGSIRQSRPRPVERRGPAERFPEAEERTLPQFPQLREFERKPASKASRRPVNKRPQAADRQQSGLPRVPQFPSLRPLQFRMPQLPQFRLPSLPSLRRPRPQSRPRPQAQQAPQAQQEPQAPVFRPQPATQAPTQAPRPQQTRPRAPSPRPQQQQAPVIAPVAPVTQSRPQTQPRPAVQADFSAFNSDPFSEFQNAE